MFNVGLAGGHLCRKQLFTWLSLVVSLMASFVLSFFLEVLDEIWDVIESVSEGFLPTLRNAEKLFSTALNADTCMFIRHRHKYCLFTNKTGSFVLQCHDSIS